MAYQFFHIETYSRKARPVTSGGYTLGHHMNSTAQVFGEALREALHSSHVENPLAPIPLLMPGLIPLEELRKLHDEQSANFSETVTGKAGTTYTRRLREDADTLYTEIHSHPMTSAEYLANRKENHPTIATWCSLAVKDFMKRMPEGVKASAVIHLDESHVHMHILAVNMGDPKLDANKLHIGKRKAAEVRANHDDRLPVLPKPELVSLPPKPKKPKPSRTKATQAKRDKQYAEALAEWEKAVAETKAQNEAKLAQWQSENTTQRQRARAKAGEPKAKVAYNAAMKQLQDDYYEAVGKPSGLLRDGPRQKRRSTKEHAEDKRRAAALAHHLNEITENEASVAKLKAQREEAEKAVAQPRAELDAKEIELDAKAKEQEATAKTLEAEKAALDERARSLDAREADIERKEANEKVKADELYEQKRQELKAVEQAAWEGIEQKAAELVGREDKILAREASLEAQIEVNEIEKTRLDAVRAELMTKETQLNAEKAEITATIEGMDRLMTKIENGELDLETKPRSIGLVHRVFTRLLQTPEANQTPLQKLLGRFVNFLARGQKGQEGPKITPDSYDSPQNGM